MSGQLFAYKFAVVEPPHSLGDVLSAWIRLLDIFEPVDVLLQRMRLAFAIRRWSFRPQWRCRRRWRAGRGGCQALSKGGNRGGSCFSLPLIGGDHAHPTRPERALRLRL